MPAAQYKPLMEKVDAVIAVSLGTIFSELTANVSARILLAVYFHDRTSAFTANQLMLSANLEALVPNVKVFIADAYMLTTKV